MRAATTLIAWTPADLAGSGPCADRRATAGSVRLLAWPVEGEALGAYAHLDGAACPKWRAASQAELVARVFILYAKMVLNGVNPLAAHVALMDIEEYRDNLPTELARQPAVTVRPAAVIRLESFRPVAQNDHRDDHRRAGAGFADVPIAFPGRRSGGPPASPRS